MQATLNTPWGKVRTATQRRWVLVRQRLDGTVTIVQRSDTLDRLLTSNRARGGDRVFDTHTGKEV